MTARKLLAVAALFLFTAPVALGQTPAPPTAAASSSTPMKVGDVLPPKLIHSVEPKLHLHHSFFHSPKPCVVLVRLTVPIDGVPTDVHIIHACNAAFDQASLDAVGQYRFDPSTLNGTPVPVALNVQVNFKIY
jgi:hypothetical protein